MALKRCSVCHEIKPLSQFHSDSSSADGLHHRCKVCKAAYKKANVERARESERRSGDKYLERVRYTSLFKERVKRANRAYRQKITTEIHDRLGGVCVVCGTEDELQIDHVNFDGAQHRAEFHGGGSAYLLDILRQLREGSRRFQLLCRYHHELKTQTDLDYSVVFSPEKLHTRVLV